MSLLEWGTRPLIIRLLGGDYTDSELTLSFRTAGSDVKLIEIPDSGLDKQLDGENTLVTWVPTQEQAGKFTNGTVFAQVNIVESGDARNATKELPVTVDINQIKRTLSFGG